MPLLEWSRTDINRRRAHKGSDDITNMDRLITFMSTDRPEAIVLVNAGVGALRLIAVQKEIDTGGIPADGDVKSPGVTRRNRRLECERPPVDSAHRHR